jgi:hypothetical protein
MKYELEYEKDGETIHRPIEAGSEAEALAKAKRVAKVAATQDGGIGVYYLYADLSTSRKVKLQPVGRIEVYYSRVDYYPVEAGEYLEVA